MVLSLAMVACGDEVVPEPRVGSACPKVAMREINDHWIATHPFPGDNAWERATYMIGNMAAIDTVGDQAFYDYYAYAKGWGDIYRYKLHNETFTRNADDHAAGQVFLQLYEREQDPVMIADLVASIDNVIESGERRDWSWIDAQFMASPVFARLGTVKNDPRYHTAMFELYTDARDRRRLFDTSTGLWFRDENYLFPAAKTPSGNKLFWSRGNGWVIGATVLTLEYLPADSQYRGAYVDNLRAMAAALAATQRDDGLWNVSLHDPNDYSGPEASGTAFFVYGIAWGIRHGLLEAATYTPVVERGWRGLVTVAMRTDGELGYVQGVGEKPGSAQPVTLGSTRDYGVGAFLLAGSEVAQVVDIECD